MAKKITVKRAPKATKRKGRKPTATRGAKVKDHLTKAQIGKLREALLEKRQSLVGDMAGIEDQAVGNHRQDPSSDPADQGTDSFEQEFSLGLLESERAVLEEINEALARIDSGTYGVCQGTGKPIGMARLQARPWARYCIEYARMVEKGLARPSREEPVVGEDEDENEDEE